MEERLWDRCGDKNSRIHRLGKNGTDRTVREQALPKNV